MKKYISFRATKQIKGATKKTQELIYNIVGGFFLNDLCVRKQKTNLVIQFCDGSIHNKIIYK